MQRVPILLALLAACAADPTPPPRGTRDATVVTDAGEADAPEPAPDAEAPDAPAPDAFAADAEAPDAPAPDAEPPPPTGPRLVSDLGLREVAVFQTTKVGLMVDARELSPRNAPIVAGKALLVRLHTTRPARARTVTGVFAIGDATFSATARITRAGVDPDRSSVVEIRVPASAVVAGAAYRAWLEADDGAPVAVGASSGARWPRDGSALPLKAQADGGGLVLMLVPFRYDTDGSRRLPDTSPAQLDRIRALLGALYPLTTIDLRVHAPVPWSVGLTRSGSVDFGEMNDTLLALRQSERPRVDVYYYGLVSPDRSLSDYCSGGCVTGQSFVPESVADTDIRVGSGVGFGTESSAWTLAHELGHLHGRSHAPCGTTGIDRAYPYAGGSIGVFGYDARTDTLLDPSPNADLMGYCDPIWISDYTYAAIWQRVIEQRGGRVIRRAAPLAVSMLERADEPGRALRWRRDATLSALPSGNAVQLSAEDAAGRALAEASGVEVQLSHGASRLVFPAWTADVRQRTAWIVIAAGGVATRVPAPRP